MPEPAQPQPEKVGRATRLTISQRLFETRPEHILVALGLIFGLLSAFVTPPMQAPDETAHFYRAYQISEGTLIPLKIHEPQPGGSTGGHLPEALGVVESFDPLRHDPDQKIVAPLATFRRLAAVSIEDSQRRFFVFSNTAVYSPLAYLPQAVGIAFGRLFTDSPIVLAYVARLATLFVWLAVVAIAVRTTPILKWSLVAVALTPMSLFVAASASADAVTNACAWWFIAHSLRLLTPESLDQSKRGERSLLLSGLMLSLVKVPYQSLALFPVGLMISCPLARSRWRVISLMLLAMAVGFCSWMTCVRSTFSPYDPSWDPSAQLRFLVSNPAALCWGTFGYLLPHFFWRTAVQFVGELGWLDTSFPALFYPLHLASLLLVALIEPLTLPPGSRQRIAIVALCVGLVASWLVCFVVLVAGTGVGAYEMFVQGRYFLPIATVLVAAIACTTPRPSLRRSWQKAAGLAWVMYLLGALTLMIVVLRCRFYV